MECHGDTNSIILLSRYEIRPDGHVLLYITIRSPLHCLCRALHKQCTFFSDEGNRCPEARRLEFHHDDPYAIGGDRSTPNIRLLCQTHNAYMAELDFGKKKMDQFRRRRTSG